MIETILNYVVLFFVMVCVGFLIYDIFRYFGKLHTILIDILWEVRKITPQKEITGTNISGGTGNFISGADVMIKRYKGALWKRGKSNRIGTAANTRYMKRLGYTLDEISYINYGGDYIDRNKRLVYIQEVRQRNGLPKYG